MQTDNEFPQKGVINQFYYAIKEIVEKSDIGLGRIFDLFIQALIVISLISFSIETLPDLEDETRHFLRNIEIACVAIFTIEYLLRLIVTDSKSKFIFSFFGMVDFLAILPFYLTTGLDLRSLRSFRLLKIIRILKLARYNSAIKRYHRALIIIKEELILFLFVTSILVYISAVGIYFFENAAQPEKYSSIFHSLWWSAGTLTTVAYGDVYPITIGGKVFTFFILILGIGIVSVPTGLFASALSKAREMDD